MASKEYDYNMVWTYNALPWPFVELRKRNPLPVLRQACAAFERLNLTYWIGFGVALGFHRQNDFIPYDTDIDMCIRLDFDTPKENDKLVMQLWAGLSAYGFKLLRVAHYGEDELQIMQLAVINKHKVPLDILFFYDNIEKDFLVHYSDVGIIRFKKEHIDGVQKRKFKHGVFPIPTPTDEYLEYYYGPNWSVPSGKKEDDWFQDGKGKSLELRDTPWRVENKEWFKRFVWGKNVAERRTIKRQKD